MFIDVYFNLLLLEGLDKKEMACLEENCKGGNMAQVILRKYRNVLFSQDTKSSYN